MTAQEKQILFTKRVYDVMEHCIQTNKFPYRCLNNVMIGIPLYKDIGTFLIYLREMTDMLDALANSRISLDYFSICNPAYRTKDTPSVLQVNGDFDMHAMNDNIHAVAFNHPNTIHYATKQFLNRIIRNIIPLVIDGDIDLVTEMQLDSYFDILKTITVENGENKVLMESNGCLKIK